jgi:hypothetical protein
VSSEKESVDGVIYATDSWPTNGHLIADCRRLGYLRDDDHVLDPTYGRGVFWRQWRPAKLTATDLDPAKSPSGESVDFTAMPWPDRSFDAVVFDPPYKLNGTPTKGVDERYGVHEPTRWQDRWQLCLDGITECTRVLGDGHLLVKCQDQVCSGRVQVADHRVRQPRRRPALGARRPLRPHRRSPSAAGSSAAPRPAEHVDPAGAGASMTTTRALMVEDPHQLRIVAVGVALYRRALRTNGLPRDPDADRLVAEADRLLTELRRRRRSRVPPVRQCVFPQVTVDLMSTSATAAALGIGIRAVRRLAERKTLASTRDATGRLWFTAEAVDAYKTRRTSCS